MLKTDAVLFNDLTSADDAVRIKAATKLEQYDSWHFKDHPLGGFSYDLAQIQSLLEGWKSTCSDLVKAWIAQALALTKTTTVEALALMADSLKLDGPCMERVAQTVYECRHRIPNGNDILRGLYSHPKSGVRWRCAMALQSLVFSKEQVADDLALMRRLLLDINETVRCEAAFAAKEVLSAQIMPGLGPEDYEVLLDVENIDSGAARVYARELMAKLEATVPGCRREAFAPREPLVRTEGIYHARRQELDVIGRWVASAFLRFFPDGTVHTFRTNEPPVVFLKRLPEKQAHVASGSFVKEGARLTFSCTGNEGHWRYEGHIDADKLHLGSVHTESGRRIEEVYCWAWTPPDWDVTPAPKAIKPTAKKGGLPFIPVKPRSMLISEAAKWYRQMLARLPLLLETTPADARLALAWETKRQLRETAARSLFDQALKKEFLATMPLPPLEELKALHGNDALQELFKITQAERWAFPGTLGEAIGLECWDGKETWVLTEQGWQRKEQS
jgi:hypothetical protein